MSLVLINSVTVPNWQGNSDSVSLFILTNAAFTASEGTLYPVTNTKGLPFGGRQSLGTFYQTFPCSVIAGSASPLVLPSLVIPAITLDSTTDSPDNPNATYSAILWDNTIGLQIQTFGTQTQFSIAPLSTSPLVTSTTWAAIFLANADSA